MTRKKGEIRKQLSPEHTFLARNIEQWIDAQIDKSPDKSHLTFSWYQIPIAVRTPEFESDCPVEVIEALRERYRPFDWEIETEIPDSLEGRFFTFK